MSEVIAPLKKVTFTVNCMPQRDADRKTIRRLMRLQPKVQRGLKALAKQRRQKDNVVRIRAGVIWVNRAKTTKLTHVEPGAEFTITITPQIIPDIKSVESFLDARPAA